MNVYVGIAWGFALLFGICAIVGFAIAILAYLGWIQVDAVIAFTLAVSCVGYLLAPLGYARDRSR